MPYCYETDLYTFIDTEILTIAFQKHFSSRDIKVQLQHSNILFSPTWIIPQPTHSCKKLCQTFLISLHEKALTFRLNQRIK